MAFTAHCPFCPAKLSNLPDKSLGATVRCPKCGSDFRAAPREEPASIGKGSRSSVPARQASAPESPIAEKDDLWSRVLKAPGKDQSGAGGAALSAALFAVTSMPRWINVWGLAGFIAGSFALLFASLGDLHVMTIPLASAGLLVVLFGVVKRLGRFKKRDLVWLPLGGLVAAVVFLLALFQPGMLNARWGMDFTVADADLNRMLLVTRDNKKVIKELAETDWADARDNAILQEDFLVSVESAAVGERPGKDATASALIITMHLSNLSPVGRIVYEGQRKRKEPAVVRDSRGQVLKFLDAAGANKKLGQGMVSLMPFQQTKEVLMYEVPPAGAAYVDLELPASAWGRQGICRFRIRRATIRDLAPGNGGAP